MNNVKSEMFEHLCESKRVWRHVIDVTFFSMVLIEMNTASSSILYIDTNTISFKSTKSQSCNVEYTFPNVERPV